jgi:hypothetical protein
MLCIFGLTYLIAFVRIMWNFGGGDLPAAQFFRYSVDAVFCEAC